MSDHDKQVLVAGAGGFIGGHLVKRLLAEGFAVKAVDCKPVDAWFQVFEETEMLVRDLRDKEACYEATRGVSDVYNLAADMGGMGFIEFNKAACMLSVLINTHLLMAARDLGVKRYFYASSACVYAADKQDTPDVVPLKEDDAYPAMPEDGYGWEKLFSERMCRHFSEDFGLQVRIGRYHNVYGPFGTWEGGREKAPAAICRKVAEAKLNGTPHIEIWGDGEQTRSFTWIDDSIEGTRLLMESGVDRPLNIGSSELVAIDQVVDLVESIAGVQLERKYLTDAPQGVRGRNSDNTTILNALSWEPRTPLEEGLRHTYGWILDQVRSRKRVR